jgi:hypothetical protein
MTKLIIVGNSLYKSIGRLGDPSIHKGKLLLQVYPASGNPPAKTILAHKVVKSNVSQEILWECDKGEVYVIPKGSIIFAGIPWDATYNCAVDWVEDDGRVYKLMEILEFTKYWTLTLQDCNTPHTMIHRSIIKEQTK